MTDKGIIVDSIDVSECEFLWKEKLPKRFCNNGNLDCDCNSNQNCYFKQLKQKEQELQTQRNFTAQEQRKIYCGAYDKTCETGNECKQKKCVFKDRLKYKQALDEIEKYLDAQQKYFDGEDYHNLLNIINSIKDSK